MFRSTTLNPSHYAGRWSVAAEGKLNDLKVVNQLGLDYALLPDSPEKEEKLLQIVELFHGYLMKYLGMVIVGTLPPLNCAAGRESKLMLKNLLDKKIPVDKVSLSGACKRLHLAFKGMTSEDIYDSLAFALMRAARKYDPFYADKVQKVCGEIEELPERFERHELEKRVDLDCPWILRMLVRKGFLASIAGPKGTIQTYQRAAWPPPPEFFKSGPIGFTHVALLWFRHYLKEFVGDRMSEVEARPNVLQLDYQTPNYARHGDKFTFGGHFDIREAGLPHFEGNCVSNGGGEYRYKADVSLMELPMDISEMTLDWVFSTKDKLFRNLSIQERRLLHHIYVDELSWREIAEAFDDDAQVMKRRLSEIMRYLKGHVAPQSVTT